MANYEFICTNKTCEHIFAEEIGMNEYTRNRSIYTCPVCKSVAKRYIKNVPPVRYNGTGFASTDIPRKSGLEGYSS